MTAKAQTEEDRCFQMLVEFRDAADAANGNSQTLLRDSAEKPRYTVSSNFEDIAQAQRRPQARDDLLGVGQSVASIRKACVEGQKLRDECLRLVQGGAITLPFPPLFVGNESFPTAHEAAFALGKVTADLWDEVGGDAEFELAPDRLKAESDGRHADAGLRMRQRLWKRSLKVLNRVPRDLWGQIQQELFVEATLDRYFPLDDAAIDDESDDAAAVEPELRPVAVAEPSKAEQPLKLTEAHLRCLRALKTLKAFGPDSRQPRDDVARTIDREWAREHVAAAMSDLSRWRLIDSLFPSLKGRTRSEHITELGLAEAVDANPQCDLPQTFAANSPHRSTNNPLEIHSLEDRDALELGSTLRTHCRTHLS